MPRTCAGSSPARCRRRSVSVRLRPQSSITTVPAASATRQLPELPLASEAKRIKAKLLELLVQQREDALRGLGALGSAFLVQHVDLAAVGILRHLHPVLRRLHLGIVREPARDAVEQALVLLAHLDLGIGVAHEVQPLLPVAVLDGEADAVERQADAPPGAIERLMHLKALGAVVALDDVGALLRRRA